MKKIIILLLLLIPTLAFAAHDVNVAWDVPLVTPAADIAGYRIYLTTIKGTYTYGTGFIAVAAGVLTNKITGVSDTVSTWAVVTTLGKNGIESSPSNELYLLAPGAPGNFRVVSIP